MNLTFAYHGLFFRAYTPSSLNLESRSSFEKFNWSQILSKIINKDLIGNIINDFLYAIFHCYLNFNRI